MVDTHPASTIPERANNLTLTAILELCEVCVLPPVALCLLRYHLVFSVKGKGRGWLTPTTEGLHLRQMRSGARA